MRTARTLLAIALLASAPPACVEEVTLEETPPATELGVGQSRTVELRFLRFDVDRFKQTLTLEDLRALPPRVLEQTWLLDMDMGPMVGNALQQIAWMPAEEATAMPQPARNLWKLLNLTAESTDLGGTSLEPLIGLGMAVGLPPSIILADLAQVSENAPLISTDITAQAVLQNVVGTHPNAQLRQGPVDEAHPDGIYPVAPHSIPVYLADVVNNFEDLAARFGPAGNHPGFVVSSSPVMAATEDFQMTVRVDINALPYKGIDATDATVASVNSTGSQLDDLFDFSQPDWLTLEGLTEDLRIGELTMAIREDDAFIPPGDSRQPLPYGNSPVWDTPPWQMEHLLASAGFARGQTIPAHCAVYAPQGTGEDPFEAVEVCIDDTGWVEIEVDESVVLEDPPPPPSYFWDVLLEVAQVRMHDGGLAEGEADVEITVRDVPVGISTAELTQQIRANIQADPASLRGVAEQLNENTAGDADFYYYQTADQSDWLFFVAPEDIRLDEQGDPARPYAYQRPGFYADPELTQELSSTEPVDGDVDHEKVRIEPGATLYFEDDAGQVYRIEVGAKPSRHRVSLTLTRVR
ncbi:MAG TPA: hypothetical protein VLS89_03350 [Candidatus Nanopelagicales bacterium]|nr:hypothetical protein [Candidatus Nanopelagicales bacterium]